MMSKRQFRNSRLDREKALFVYSSALERGDFDTVASILEQAEQDAPLAQMITELNDYHGNRSTLPFEHPAVPKRAYVQGEKSMQVTGKIGSRLEAGATRRRTRQATAVRRGRGGLRSSA